MTNDNMQDWAAKVRQMFTTSAEALAAFDFLACINDGRAWTPEARSALERHCQNLDAAK